MRSRSSSRTRRLGAVIAVSVGSVTAGLAVALIASDRARADRHLTAGAVFDAFDQNADSYDRLVDANPGYDDHLRESARRLRLTAGGGGKRVLDVGCGTGRSTAALRQVHPEASIVGVDASAEMLASAREKAWPRPDRVRFVHARAEDLPERLAAEGVDGSFDALLAAYLVRNLPDPDAGLAVLVGSLRPGAPVVVHEYSVADSARSRLLWTLVCWTVIIPMGWWVTGDPVLYRYLWRSVLAFDGIGQLQERMRAAGLVDVRVEPMDGWQRGIVHSVIGRVPSA